MTGRKMRFVFDLDSTVTRCELLPEIARSAGLGEEMAALTEQAMRGEVPFAQSFASRVALLTRIPIPQARKIAAGVPLNEEIARFLHAHAGRCLIMTGNLDVWIGDLLERLGMRGRCVCSEALAEGNRLLGVQHVLDKAQAAGQIAHPFVAIGDGSNDVGMLCAADVGVAFGGVRKPSEQVRRAADVTIDDEAELCRYLEKLL